ncbi:RNA-directed DNA polymerase from mobile element jockey-like protein [Aphelenchoides avenae]|nr:RNA-directed DNA polymerase from mobile element jockey-like protein [Aphelenchus avenae]
MERLVRRRLLDFLDEHKVLPESQFGFRPKRSVRDALIGSIEAWSKAVDSNLPVDIIYFDFTAAFDKVQHGRLLHKLSSCGVDGYLLQWIRCYADDVNISVEVRTDSDRAALQASVDNLVEWSLRNDLPLSVPKCNVLHLGAKNRKQSYLMDGEQISEEANSKLFLFMRLIKSNDPELLCKIFKVYVRPIVETCSSTFVITTKKEIEQLESVQRRFTKAAFMRAYPGEDLPDYRERCTRLELETLEERRIRSDLILAKKILLGKCATKSAFRLKQSRTRGGATKFDIPHSRTKMRESTFFVRAATILSKLNTDFVLNSSLGVFKTFVKDLDLAVVCDLCF